jgi:hypothetical protein
MKRSVFLPLLGLVLCAAPALAQGPGPGPGGPMPAGPGMMMMHEGPGPDPAGMLLAATGYLHLTDAQVLRLAAIARRAEERHAAMRTSMQAAHADASARQAPPDAEMARMRQAMEQLHQQAQADLRDALAVLSPDQQAMAFEMVAHHVGGHGPGDEHGEMGPGGHGMMMRHRGGPPPREDAPPPPRPDAR